MDNSKAYQSIDQSIDTIQSKVISFLRFPLMVAVVFIHSEPHILVDVNTLINGGIYNIIYTLFTGIIAGCAVPLFFFFSGFLFFKGPFNGKTYLYKLRRRVKTLLIPYILWNIIVWLIFLCKSLALPGATNEDSLVMLHGTEWLRMFWNLRSGIYPMCAQFWFLRDLMVVMILSPGIYWMLRVGKVYGIVILSILWIFNFWINVPGFSLTALYFFSFVSYFAITNTNFVNSFRSLRKVALAIFPLLLLLAIILSGTSVGYWIRSGCVLVEIILCVTISSYYIRRGIWGINNFLSESSFFLYAYHQIFLSVLIKALVDIVMPTSGFTLCAIYFVGAGCVILVGLGLYYVLRRYMPKVTGILTGGR